VKTFEATFQKNCGNDDVCKSNLVLTAGIELESTFQAQKNIFVYVKLQRAERFTF
jgi:hypothetical protein